MTANTITDVICADADAVEGDGRMCVTLNQPDEQAQAVLRGLELHLMELSEQYPENIKIIYGGVKNA